MTLPTNNPADAIELIDGELDTTAAPVNTSIMKSVILRLWRPHVKMEAQLAVEVIEGPYKGIIFGFSEFNVGGEKTADGFRPVKFTTKLFKAPKEFVKDAAWDSWSSELLIAWLGHVTTSSYVGLMRAHTEGVH